MKVLRYPDPRLFKKARNVTQDDIESLPDIINKMWKICRNKKRPGVGLAATQVGLDLNLFVTFYKNLSKFYINTELMGHSTLTEEENEGCLSFNRSLSYPIERPLDLTIRHSLFDLNERKIAHFSGFEARIIAHEYDHCQGITMHSKWKTQNNITKDNKNNENNN